MYELNYKIYKRLHSLSQQEEAALAKSRGKSISPHHAPVQIFWNAMKPTAMVSTLPPVPEETSMQDPQLEGPLVRTVHQSNLVWDPRVSVAKESDEQQRAKRQEKEGSSMSMADIVQISEELHRQPPPTASQYVQPKSPLKSVVHEAKKMQGKSIFELLGKKPDKREHSPSQKRSIIVRGRGAGKTVRKVSVELLVNPLTTISIREGMPSVNVSSLKVLPSLFPRLQFLIACSTASDQKLELGKAWGRG